MDDMPQPTEGTEPEHDGASRRRRELIDEAGRLSRQIDAHLGRNAGRREEPGQQQRG